MLRSSLWAWGVAVLSAGGCADEGPRLRLLDEPVTAVGLVDAPLRFAVDHCSSFEVAVVDGDGVAYPVGASRLADGSYEVRVPTRVLQNEDYSCVDDADATSTGSVELVVTCSDGHVATATVEAVYGTATHADGQYSTSGFIDALQPTRYPREPASFWLLDPPVEGFPFEVPDGRGVSLRSGSLIRWTELRTYNRPPVLVASTPGWLALAMVADEQPIAIADGVEVSSAWVESFVEPQDLSSHSDPPFGLRVPAPVRALAMQGEQLLVLSAPRDQCKAPWTVLSVVSPGDTAPAVVAYLPGETLLTDVLATTPPSYVTVAQDGTVTRHVLDGTVLTSTTNVTGRKLAYSGTCSSSSTYYSFEHALWVSPDATTWVLRDRQGTYFAGSPEGGWTELGVRPSETHWHPSEIVFLDHAIAVGYRWLADPRGLDGDGALDVFDRAPPHARRFGYDVHPLLGSAAVAHVLGLAAAADEVALSTSTGLRVLNLDGELVAGADPLPCGLLVTAPVIRSGPSAFAIAAGSFVYVFERPAP